MSGAISPRGSPRKPLETGEYHHRVEREKGKKGNIIRLGKEPNLKRSHVVVAVVLIASQTGFVQTKFIRGSAVTRNGENFSVHDHQRPLIL